MRSISAVVSIGVSLVAEALLCVTFAAPAQAQFPPPPPSVGATVPATYFLSDILPKYSGSTSAPISYSNQARLT